MSLDVLLFSVGLIICTILGFIFVIFAGEKLFLRPSGRSLRANLRREEKILWSDWTEPSTSDPVVLGWVSLWLVAVGASIYSRQWAVALPLGLIGLIGILINRIHRYRVEYIVTSERAVILTHFPSPRLQSVEIASLDRVDLIDLPGGLGTLTLVESVASGSTHAEPRQSHQLLRLKKPDKVKITIKYAKKSYELLKEANARRKEAKERVGKILSANPCECLEPMFDRCEKDGRLLGTDKTNGRFGDVSLYTCGKCGRIWLCYSVEYEAFTASGRWYRAIIPPDVAQTVTPETAATSLENSDYRIRGGSFFNNSPGEAEYGPGLVSVDNLGSPNWWWNQQERNER